jgi:hypothetical protein
MYTAKEINCVATHKVCSVYKLYKNKGLCYIFIWCVCVCVRACVRMRERERETSAVTDFALQGTKIHVFCPHKFIMKIIYWYF